MFLVKRQIIHESLHCLAESIKNALFHYPNSLRPHHPTAILEPKFQPPAGYSHSKPEALKHEGLKIWFNLGQEGKAGQSKGCKAAKIADVTDVLGWWWWEHCMLLFSLISPNDTKYLDESAWELNGGARGHSSDYSVCVTQQKSVQQQQLTA